MHDHHFDDLAVRFAEKIYGGNKGAIRLAVLQADLTEALPQRTPLRILDIGAGLGHISLWLAQQGHQLVLAEPSIAMLEQAKLNFANANCTAEFIHADWQHICQQAMRPLLKPNGWLSLAFYNKDALIFQNLVKGNLRKLKKQQYAGDAGGLTPQQPIDQQLLAQQLNNQGWHIKACSGIRVFHDYMRPEIRQKITDEELITTELNYRRHPTLAPLGRYLHWLCQG